MGTYKNPKEDKDTRRKMELSKRWRNQPTSTWVVIIVTLADVDIIALPSLLIYHGASRLLFCLSRKYL